MGRPQRKIDARCCCLILLAAIAVLGACAQPGVLPLAVEHRVRPGETLSYIADGYGVDVHRLARVNHLGNVDRVEVGRRVVIPDGARIVHRVRPGEKLTDVAARYGVRDSTIASQNRLRSTRLTPGQRLVMPRDALLPAPMGAVAAGPRKTPAPRAARVAPHREAPAPAPAPTPAALPDPNVGRAEAMVDGAVDDYRGARFERALDKASGAELLIERSGDAGARSLGARAAFVKGSALAALGQRDRAVRSFARVHELDAGFTPPDGWLSPRLEELYLAAKND